MDTLTVFAQPESISHNSCVVRVFWRTGLHRRQAVDIKLNLDCSDKQAAAELIAIRFLLGDAHAFSKNRVGKNLRIVVSKGAIKKLSRQATQKKNLYDYGYPIFTRYAGAEIVVSKDSSWFPTADELNEVPVVSGEDYNGMEKIESEQLGQVAITRHALERYAQHCDTINIDTTWKNLCRRLINTKMERLKLPERVILHKLKRYGQEPEVWMNPENPLHYVFCNNSDHKILVTVFNKDPDEHLQVFHSHYINHMN